MARFTRLEVASVMEETGIVPLFYNESIDTAKKLLEACYNGGARVVEFTSRGDGAFKIFDALEQFATASLPGMILGVGSVTDAAAASLYMQIGANFIVTPVFREDIAIVCNRRKVLWSPGCGSLTEIAQAEQLGCEIVKLFPGGIYGASFVKAIKGPCPWTSVMPTGGVSPTRESLEEWFKAGVTCVGLGSKLIAKNEEGTYDFNEIEKKTKFALDLVSTIKTEMLA